jgi:serine/threonine protein phosphatase PrpC
MSVGRRHALKTGDLILACTDGLWSNLHDPDLGVLGRGPVKLRDALQELCNRAVMTAAPNSDNTSAAVLRWLR